MKPVSSGQNSTSLGGRPSSAQSEPSKISIDGVVSVSEKEIERTIEAYTARESKPWWSSPAWYALFLSLITSILATRAFYISRAQFMLATNPRLRIEGVRAEGLKHGGRPVFIVTLVNDGRAPAENVEVHMRVEGETSDTDTIGHKMRKPQLITVPADSKKKFWIVWKSALHQQEVDRFNLGGHLNVSGYFKYGNKAEEKFSYRYFPWSGAEERPEGIDQFIPSDFDPSLTIVMKALGGKFDVSGLPIDSTHNKDEKTRNTGQ
jgi:hypothetical protein